MEGHEEEVSSNAVVKYEVRAIIPSYVQLEKDTDLNTPPSNWLRDNLIGKFPYENVKNSEPFDYSSLLMAARYPEIVGEVDVVAGANLIKRLLKMPFSDASLSMSAHRIGKTLLLSHLDVPSILSSQYYENESLTWLKDLYCEARGVPLDSEFHPKKRNKEQSELQAILSKFMYHSIVDQTMLEGKDLSQNSGLALVNGSEDQLLPTSTEVANKTLLPTPRPSLDLIKADWSVTPQDSSSEDIEKPSLVPRLGEQEFASPSSERVELKKDDLFTPQSAYEGPMDDINSDSAFSRDVLWTFEDITMLVGSNLPIFGGGKYPAVSLRLRDSSKPINILTGIDYWLDNLMCNVPELIMCFHLKGIVQKYEKIKTTDLPEMEECRFSPKVVKDIAQNILSFLKANCTKEGHTYWLFKSSKDDVIKLYDLTSICSERTDGKQVDPFSVSVAVLLYNIARNMYTSGDITSERKLTKIRSLLKNCITLLETKDRPDISLLANCLLIELYADHEKKEDESDSEGFDESSDEMYSTDDDVVDNDKTSEPITTVSVKMLGSPTSNIKIDKVPPESKSEKSILVAVTHESRCKSMIMLITNALRSINLLLYLYKVEDISLGKPVIPDLNINNQIKSLQLTQHNRAMLASIKTDLKCFYEQKKKSVSTQVLQLRDEMSDLTLGDVRILLLEKAVECHITLVNIYISKEKFGRALQLLQTSMHCLDNAMQMSPSSACNMYLTIDVLKLYGDVLTIMGQKTVNVDSELEQFSALSDLELGLRQLLDCSDTREFSGIEMSSLGNVFALSREELLNAAESTYEKAITIIGDTDVKETELGYQKRELCRRLGNIRNEMGVMYMNKAASVSKTYGLPSDEEMALWKRSFALYEGAIMSFKLVEDRPNMALLYINEAKLMHLSAQVYGNSTRATIDARRGQFTSEEKTYFNKSFEYYQSALSVLHSKQDYPNIWTSVSLELSGVYCSMATTIQDNSTNVAEEKVTKEISSAFMKALHYLDSVLKGCKEKQLVAVKHRIGSIHYKLAQLYTCVLVHRSSEVDRKNYRSLAELHFKKIYSLLETTVFPMDVLRAVVRHLEFYDNVLKQSLTWKFLRQRVEMFFTSKHLSVGETNSTILLATLQTLHARLTSASEDEGGRPDSIDPDSVRLLLGSLDSCVKTTFKDVIKFLSQNKNKKGDYMDVKVVKGAYELILRGLLARNDNVGQHVKAFIDVLSSVQELIS